MAVLNALLEISVYSAVIYLGIWLFGRLFRGKLSARLKYALWFLLILRLLLPVTVASPVHLPVLPQKGNAPAQVQSADGGIVRYGAPVPGSAPVSDPADAENRAAVPAGAAPAGPAVAPPSFRIGWPGVLLYVWLAGAAGMLLYFAVLSSRMRRRIKRECSAAPVSLNGLMDELRRDMGIRGRPEMLIAQGDGSPCLTASLRPRLLMPAALLARFDRRQLAFAVGHELTHYRRRDYLTGMLLNLLRCVYWFHPVVWLAAAQMRADMEAACDSDMIGAMGDTDRKRYAETLLMLFNRGGRRSLALGMAEGNARAAAERRIRGIFSKRKSCRGARWAAAALALVILVACFTTACQPTPTKPPVVGKDIGNMLEQAKATPGTPGDALQTADTGAAAGAALKARLRLPERFTADLADATGRLTVKADAAFALPAADKLPVARVGMDPFPQATVDKLMEVLLQGQPLYDTTSAQQQTKEDILQLLQRLYDMRDGKIPVAVDGNLEENIRRWEKAFKEAPAEVKLEPADTKLHPFDMSIYGNGKTTMEPYDYMEGNARINGVPAYFTVINNIRENRVEATFVHRASAWGAHGFMPWIVIPEQGAKSADGSWSKPSIGPEQARQIADAIVSELNLADTFPAVTTGWAMNDTDHMLAYVVQYRRAVNDAPITATGHRGVITSSEPGDSDYAPAWPYEAFDIYVTDDGITELQWVSPYTKPQMVTDDAKLLPFPDIRQRFESMILARYAVTDENESVELQIDGVQLGLMRIKDPQHQGTGLLIPVWDFFGQATYHQKEKGEWTLPRDSLLTINAIDGSIIDRGLGY